MTPVLNRDRRHFLGQMGLGFLSLAANAVMAAPRPTTSVDAIKRLVSLSPDRNSARRVGRAILAGNDRVVDTESLLRSVLGEDWRSLLTMVDDDRLQYRLDTIRRRDFATARVVVFDGWVLARSEADFCILSAIV